MNEVPPSDDLPEDVDEQYRRASALDPSRPSKARRQAVLKHAAELAAERATKQGAAQIYSTRSASNRVRWRPAIFGTLAAAALAGLLITPHFLTYRAAITASRPENRSANVNAPAPAPSPNAAGEKAAPPPAVAQGGSEPSPLTAREKTAPPPAEGKGRSEPSPVSADASRSDTAAESRAAARSAPAPMPQAPSSTEPAALWRAAEIGDFHALQALLEEPVRVDARDASGRTALMLAVLHGHADAVDALLAHGADPNAADARGTMPLQAAVASNQPVIVAALRRAGARAH